MTDSPKFPVEDQLIDPPRLAIGWRRGQRLAGRRIELHNDTHETLRTICASAVERLNAETTKAREYQAFGILEQDEVYFIRPGESSSSDLDSASLVELVNNVDSLDPADPAESRKLAFYAVVWGPAGSRVGFVRKTDPRLSLAKGRSYFSWDNALRRVERPDFVLESSIDLIIDGHTALILNEPRSRMLMNDIGLAAVQVEENIDGLASILGGADSITDSAREALLVAGRSGVSVARRLAQANVYYSGRTLDRSKIRQQAVKKFGKKNADALFDTGGRLRADAAHIKDALDVIEGRLYKDPVSDEERRADRLSKR